MVRASKQHWSHLKRGLSRKNTHKVHSSHLTNRIKPSSNHEGALLDLGVGNLCERDRRERRCYFTVDSVSVCQTQPHTYVEPSGAVDRLRAPAAEHGEGPFLGVGALFKTQTEDFSRQVDVPVGRMLLDEIIYHPGDNRKHDA